jgi:hypothetical protein
MRGAQDQYTKATVRFPRSEAKQRSPPVSLAAGESQLLDECQHSRKTPGLTAGGWIGGAGAACA